jgi:poly-gamma-glutamate capsule biosynthesis protein CapA/YwtB (metallophosphatase superfamily)
MTDMTLNILLTGDVNLMNVTEPEVPFRKVAGVLRDADLVFSNLECCLYAPQHGVAVDLDRTTEGFFADPVSAGQALLLGGIQSVGVANNVNYGSDAITASLQHLDRIGVPHTGAGANAAAARAPIVLERRGRRVGILQRTAVYWPSNHEASPVAPGVAALKCHTAYHIPFHRLGPDQPTPNRPGVPPVIHTWVDKVYLKTLQDDVAALRERVDVVIVSLHWGLDEAVLDYMTELAHAAVNAGADVVMGHGPHYSLPVEIYRGKPIFYGVGSFSFHTGHAGKKHGDWIGMLARIQVGEDGAATASLRFVRHNDANETYLCDLANEKAAWDALRASSETFGVRLQREGDELVLRAMDA